jgi:hypothetical protein
MKNRKLVEVKVFEPAKHSSLGECKIDGQFSHLDRHRFTNCWQKPLPSGAIRCWQLGCQGRWDFVDGVCLDFLGRYRAEIVGEISRDRQGEKDRFVSADAAQLKFFTQNENFSKD